MAKSHTFIFTVKVEVSHTEGKFATLEELESAIFDEIEQAEPDALKGDGGGEYSVDSWEVEASTHVPLTSEVLTRELRELETRLVTQLAQPKATPAT